MRLSRRLMVWLYGVAFGAVVAGVLAVYFLVMPSFFSLENDAVQRDVSRVENALVQILTTLHARARDWSARPDVQAMVFHHRQPPHPLLPNEDLGAMNLDHVALLWKNGSTKWLRGSLPDRFLTDLRRRFADRDCYSFWGVARLNGQPAMFAMEPVGDSCNAVFFAIDLDREIAEELSGITRMPVKLGPLNGGDFHHDIQVHHLSPNTMRGTFLIRDYEGKPLLQGSTVVSRPVYGRGVRTLGLVSLALLVITLTAATLAVWFIRRLVFRRLARMHETVNHIAQGRDLSPRLSLGGDDELTDLADDFNHMVENIREAQGELARAREQAEGASRAKSLFLANMSHEIRTPMTAILGYTDLLRQGGLSAEEQGRYLEIVQQNGDALLALISDVLDLSRIEAGQVQVEHREFSLPRLLREVINTHALRAREKGVELSLSFQSSVPERLVTDPYRLRQILVNLVGNAVKFTDEGSVAVMVRWEAGLQPFLHVSVRDTGIGISPDALNGVFEPFSQVDGSHTRRFGGSGLGLAIARQLARSMGGDIEAQSNDGHGSEFHLHLRALVPAGSQLVWPRVDEKDPPQETAREPIRLSGVALLAEDNEVNRLFVKRVLEDAGMTVAETANGEQALSYCVSNTPDLIVMDMQMPVMDGYKAVRALRQQGYEGPVLALTANAMADDRKACLQAGCNEFIAKPVRVNTLLTVCRKLLDV